MFLPDKTKIASLPTAKTDGGDEGIVTLRFTPLAHSLSLTGILPSVFRLRVEPFIRVRICIINTIKKCHTGWHFSIVAGQNSVAQFAIPKLSYFKPNASLARFMVSDATTRAFSAPSSRILFNTSGFLNFS